MKPNALLSVDGRKPILPADGQSTDKHKWRKCNEANRSYDKVNGSFHFLAFCMRRVINMWSRVYVVMSMHRIHVKLHPMQSSNRFVMTYPN